MFKIQTLNNISVTGLNRLPRDKYEIASELQKPDAILLRSAVMHELDIPDTLKAVGRAGAGVNNIPVEKMSKKGIPVFNTPGANSNAVKELVIAGMLITSRNLCQGWDFSRKLEGNDKEIHEKVESGKKKFVGSEISGKTLGVIGLGAIGRLVANAAISLGMKVLGFDPGITVESAWKLSSDVEKARGIEDLLSRVDFVTVHVPLNDMTKKLLNADRFSIMKKGSVVLNFSREGIVDEDALIEALNNGQLGSYVSDFPTAKSKDHPKIITLPHLGASTEEAEENCAVMIADQISDYLENGNIINSVNFPEVIMQRTEGYRISIINRNVPNMVGQFSTVIAKANINIIDMLNKSRGDIAYTLADVNVPVPDNVIDDISKIEGVLSVRTF